GREGGREGGRRHGPAPPHLLERGDGPAAGSEVVLADGLHPVDRSPLDEEPAEVPGTEADAVPQSGPGDAHAQKRRSTGRASPELLTFAFSFPTLPCRPWPRSPSRSWPW